MYPLCLKNPNILVYERLYDADFILSGRVANESMIFVSCFRRC